MALIEGDRSEWLQVLERLTGGDKNLARTLQDVAAYILSGASHLRVILWLYGPRGTGKSTFAELLTALLGEMAASIDPKYLQDDSARERLGAVTWNKRLAICAEAGGQRIESELLKMLSGGDSFPVRFLHREGFKVRPSHALMMVANDPPRTDAHDQALRERVIALPFTHPLSQNAQGEEEPLQLTGGPRIKAARSDVASPLVRGFTVWALEGLERFYREQQIYRAPVVVAACARFWADADPVTPFRETVEEEELKQGVPRPELRQRYETWCQAEGARSVAHDRWKKACEAHGLEEKKKNGVWGWRLFGAIGAPVPNSFP